MTGLFEATLEPEASSLRDVKARMRSLFPYERVAVSAGQFLDGLLDACRSGRVILGRGGTRQFWTAGIGMQMRCADVPPLNFCYSELEFSITGARNMRV